MKRPQRNGTFQLYFIILCRSLAEKLIACIDKLGDCYIVTTFTIVNKVTEADTSVNAINVFGIFSEMVAGKNGRIIIMEPI